MKRLFNIRGFSLKKAGGVIAGVIAFVTYLLFSRNLTGTSVPTAELFDGKATFRFIDVGQGDATLVTYGGESLLIDSGPTSYSSSTAEYVSLYAPRLDYFIITHPHEDHMGGAAEILKSSRVEYLILSSEVSEERFYKAAVETAEKRGTKIIYLTNAYSVDSDGISFDILDTSEFHAEDLNNESLIVRVDAGGTVLLVVGDAEEEEEKYLLENDITYLDADYLKVGHHGSSSSTTEAFLKAVSPKAAVISCGKNNPYGHPSSTVVKRLVDFGVTVYRTDEDGTVVLRGERSAYGEK